MQAIVQRKIARKKAGISEREGSEDPALDLPESHLLFVEHPACFDPWKIRRP